MAGRVSVCFREKDLFCHARSSCLIDALLLHHGGRLAPHISSEVVVMADLNWDVSKPII